MVLTACRFHIDPPIEPDIEIVNILNWDVIVVYIPQSKNKLHKLTLEDKITQKKFKRAYIRIGEKSIVASREMARLLQYQREDSKPLQLSIGDNEKRLFNYLEKYERITVKDYSRLVNISKRRAERILISLVRAGALQIHNDILDYFTLL
jgi:predicted HTH transcriptional regulator